MKTQNNMRVIEPAIPFAVGSKPSGIGYGLSADDITKAFTAAVHDDVAENKTNGFPVAKYDADRKQAYLEKPDGTREYVHG